MRRLLWIALAVAFVLALTGYLLAKPFQDRLPPEPELAFPSDPPQTAQPASSVKSSDLPVTQIILYSSGVGYFQREGQVDGNAHVDLAFPVQDINDLLKSMVLQDLGGGQISAVSYDSHDPLDKTLNTFALRLADNPSQGQILNQARGEKVEITLARAHGSPTAQGTIVGVEVKAAAGKEAPPVEMLNIWSEGAIRSLPLAEVQQVKFLNPAMDSEVRRALDVLATSHDQQKKTVNLQFRGSGKRAVRVGYVVETPLWRTSYRLLIDSNGKLFVQGWALVDNPSSEDWKNVRMALVSGRPISFKMDLYQPLYAPRPVVQFHVPVPTEPTSYTGTTSQLPPPLGTGEGPARTSIFGLQTQQAGQISLENGIVAAATTSDLGNSFQYAVEQPVTIPRQKSAMLPIVNERLEGDAISIYSAQANAKHPLLALRIKNTTGVHLMQGPVAVFEGTGYAGDAQLPDLRPGEERLVSYALDLRTEVDYKPGERNARLASIRLHKGMLTSVGMAHDSVTYIVTNRSQQDRVVLVEHPRRPEYRLVSKDKPREEARDVYRFEKKVAAGKTVHFEVAEERDARHEVHLVNLNDETIRYYLQCEFSDASAKQAFEKLLELRGLLGKRQEELARLEQELNGITTDQTRLRANLKEMPATATAYKRYLEKFDSQETAIEKLQQQIKETQGSLKKQQLEVQAYLESLDVEATVQKMPPECRPAVQRPS
jgi:hypothetical protein